MRKVIGTILMLFSCLCFFVGGNFIKKAGDRSCKK